MTDEKQINIALDKLNGDLLNAKSLKEIQDVIDDMFDLLHTVKISDANNTELINKINAEIERAIETLDEPQDASALAKMAVNRVLHDSDALYLGGIAGFIFACIMYIYMNTVMKCHID